MKKNRTAILKHLCACALTITMAFVVPSAGYAAGTDTLGFGAGGPGTNVDAYGNPVSGKGTSDRGWADRMPDQAAV